jgi:hypothetical protein
MRIRITMRSPSLSVVLNEGVAALDVLCQYPCGFTGVEFLSLSTCQILDSSQIAAFGTENTVSPAGLRPSVHIFN